MRNISITCILVTIALLFFGNQNVYSQDLYELLRTANELEKEGKVDQAIEMCLDYYENNPERYEILQSIAEYYNRDKRYDNAIEYMEKLIVKDADFLFQGAHFTDQCDRLLNIWEKADGFELAAEHYSKYINNQNVNIRTKVISEIILGDIAERSKDLEKQREHYYKTFELVKSTSNDWEKMVNRVLIRKFMDQRLYDDALTIYRNYPNYSYLIQLGQWLKQQGRGYEMVDLYENFLFYGYPEKEKYYNIWEYDPQSLSVNVINELVAVRRGESLTGQFNDLIASDPKNPELHKRFAYMLIKMRRNEEALREIENYLISREQTLASDYEWASDLCEQAKLTDIAIQYYEIAREMEITDIEIRRESTMSQMSAGPDYWKENYKAQILDKLGNIYIGQKQWMKAESCYKEIAEMESNYRKEDAQKKLAQIWEQMGKDNTFIESMEEKITEQPENEQIRVEYANTLLNSNKTNEAVIQYEKAVELSPEDISLRLKLADSLAEGKQNERAIEEYKAALFMAAKKNQDEFYRGKGGDNTEPRYILNRLSNFCEKADEKDKLLEIYIDVLVMFDSPETKWEPDKYVLQNILRDMTEIYESKGKYSATIELWLGYHKEMTYYARSAIQNQLEFYKDVEPFINQLQKETSEAPEDYWGKFILADMLYAQNNKEEAMEIYEELIKDAAKEDRLQHDLIRIFQRTKQYDLMLEGSINAMAHYGPGSRDYGRALGNIAEIYLKLNKKEKAVEFYQNAIACDISKDEYEQFNKALYKITGEEKPERTESFAIKPLIDLDKMRRQAEQLDSSEENYEEAEKLYKQILEIAPTDLNSMTRLARIYIFTNRIQKATDLLEEVVFDEDMRVWANNPENYYGAASSLGGIYRQNNDIKNMIKLYVSSDWQELMYVQRDLKSDEQKKQFHEYLMEQSNQTPNNQKLNYYLVNYFAERNELAKAQEIAERLYNDLSDEQGNVTDRNKAIALAKSYETIGQFEKALSVLSYFDYKNDTDTSFDWLGEILMRLHAKTNQFDKALEICGLRLEKDPRGYKTVQIAEQLAESLLSNANGNQILDSFLDTIKDEIPERNYRRFRGAATAYIESHPNRFENVSTTSSETDLLALLKQGRIVDVPQNCNSFADFLEKIAAEADTLAEQSFMSGIGKEMKSPRINIPKGSAFEILAMALDGSPIPMEITQEGYWEFYEAGDLNRKISYAAAGGLLWSFEGFYREDNEDSIRLFGKVLSNPSLRNEIVSIQSELTITDAIDNEGTRVKIAQPKKIRHGINQIQISFKNNGAILETIKELKVKSKVSLCTKWSTFTVNQLDYDKPISLEDNNMTIEIEPIKETTKELKREWDINMTVQSKDILTNTEPTELKYEIFFVTGEEKKPIYTIGGTYKYKDTSKLRIHSEDQSLNPSTTSLLIRFPAEIEIAPFELTFNNIPVLQRR